MYMKKYIFLAASALPLASCTSEDFLGNIPGNVQSNTSAINFDGGTGKISRATTQTGATAAQTLGKSYVVYGYKTAKDNSTTTVFDHYTINWNNLAGKTESNTCGWEYVGEKTNSLSGLGGDKDQTIKYWDYSASQYDFVAFSFGEAIQGEGEGKVKATEVTTTPKLSYTLTGAVKDLANCFIADRITAKPNLETTNKKANLLVGYKDDVQFNFRSLSTKVTMGIYETIPGYSVKDVVFYSNGTTALSGENNKPTLYAANATIPSGKGTISVTFPTTNESNTDYNKAHVKFDVATGSENSSSIQFGTLSTVNKEKNEKTESGFIGRDITTFSTPKKGDGTTKDYNVVIPAEVGALTLKVDYTLESIDGSGETIKVTGATAAIPAAFSKWEANTRYTYLFKISDNTNGTTGTPGTDDPGLYPITFDAVVKDVAQGTTTTVATPSITTYQEGSVVGNTIEYKTGKPIYATVYDQATSDLKDLTTSGDVEVYKLSKERTEAELQVTAIFNEEIKPENKITTASVPTTSTTVNNVTLDANKYLTFTPDAAGHYAIKYKYAADTYKYKVIEVK